MSMSVFLINFEILEKIICFCDSASIYNLCLINSEHFSKILEQNSNYFNHHLSSSSFKLEKITIMDIINLTKIFQRKKFIQYTVNKLIDNFRYINTVSEIESRISQVDLFNLVRLVQKLDYQTSCTQVENPVKTSNFLKSFQFKQNVGLQLNIKFKISNFNKCLTEPRPLCQFGSWNYDTLFVFGLINNCDFKQKVFEQGPDPKREISEFIIKNEMVKENEWFDLKILVVDDIHLILMNDVISLVTKFDGFKRCRDDDRYPSDPAYWTRDVYMELQAAGGQADNVDAYYKDYKIVPFNFINFEDIYRMEFDYEEKEKVVNNDYEQYEDQNEEEEEFEGDVLFEHLHDDDF